jgi:uncharacterized membrane protein YoaK (UPF0700 family)
MQGQRREMGVALVLAAVAGCVDSLGYLTLKGFFVSFMSGNSTRLAIGLATDRAPVIVEAGGLIGLFVSGVLVGRLVDRPQVVLALVAVLLGTGALSATLGHDRIAVGLSALALGAANNVVQKAGTVSIAATYMTGTLVKMGHAIADALRGSGPRGWLPYLLLWGSLLAGAVLGAALYPGWGMRALWLPAGVSAGLAWVPVGRGRDRL